MCVNGFYVEKISPKLFEGVASIVISIFLVNLEIWGRQQTT